MGAENERFYSLLSMLDLEDRMITANDAVQISALMEKKIDYTNVYNKIKEERIHTDKFFEKFGI